MARTRLRLSYSLVPLLGLCVVFVLAGCGAPRTQQRSKFPQPAGMTLEELVHQAQVVYDDQLGELPIAPANDAVRAHMERHDAQAKSDGPTQSWYAEHEYAPTLLADGRWSPDVDLIVNTLDHAHEHALRGSYPPANEFLRTRETLQRLNEGIDALRHFKPTDDDWGAVRARLKAEGVDPDAEGSLQDLITRLGAADTSNPMPRLRHRMSTLSFLAERRSAIVGHTEARLAFALARYASEMRLRHRENTPRLKPFVRYAKRSTRYAARVRAFFGHLEHNGAQAALADLSPAYPQYAKLVEARKLYVDIVRSGGWGEVSMTRMNRLRAGYPHPTVAQVKRRLAAEGYEVGPLDDVFDAAVRDAIALYRETHQLRAKGSIDRTLVNNLNLPAKDRLAKIDITLERMRSSNAGQFGQYILVNIPDFHAEVWRSGKRAMRFGIVVGNNALQMDPETNKPVIDKKTKEPLRPNRTPLQTAFMRYVIYNPYWNVPPRIRDEELEPKLLENPYWYEENGYELMLPDNPDASWVRQLPGPDNTLGRVKFIFPNPYDVYLHDTAAKGLFRNPVRAYSHGCMRVSTPLAFAEHLLREDGQWDKRQVESILDTEPYKETTFVLRRPLPVHVVYFNTRVHDSGHVAFLSDIYRYDEPRVEKRKKVLQTQLIDESSGERAEASP